MKKFLVLLVVFGFSLPSLFADNAPKSDDKPTVYLVSNAHFDTQWRWDVRRSIGEFLRNTMYQNISLFETYPEYVFNFEGAVKYAWMKEYYPDVYEKVKSYVQQGRWNVAGSSWDANDPNIPSPESFIRNIMLGQEFYKNEFGVTSDDIMLPDCFGFGYALPTLAAHCGLDNFHTQKLQWRYNPFYGDSKIPFYFGWWEGIDGNRLLAVMDGGDYNWNPSGDITDDADLKARIADSPVDATFRYYGTRSSESVVDRGGSPFPWAVESAIHAVNNPKDYYVKLASVNDMFDDYRNDPALPTFNGELLMDVHATGCYTSVAQMKNLNRRNENMAVAAEEASVIADWFGVAEYPHYVIDEAWKRMLWHQFHDDLTGTSIPEVYQFSYNDEYINLNQFGNVARTGVMSVASAMNTNVKGIPVVVYNPISAVNRTPVEIALELPAGMNDVVVYDGKGRKMRSQIVSREGNVATVLFESVSSSVGISVYDVRPVRSRTSFKTSLKASGNVIENAVYRIELNENGDIMSMVDKRCGKEIVKAGEAIALAVFENNVSEAWPSWEIIKDVIDQEPKQVTENVSVRLGQNGPLRASLIVEKTYGDTRFVQEIILTDGGIDQRVDIRTYVDWQSEASLLKSSFPMSFASSQASYDLGIGNVKRGNNTATSYETYGHQWADVTSDDGSYGVTIMNDCKYGWDKPDDNTIRLTLLHTPVTTGEFQNQNTQDLGEHTFTYSIVGHLGTLCPSEASVVSDALNQGKLAYVAEKHKGALGKEFSMVSGTTPDLRIKALKKAQDGDGIIVRTYEVSGNGASGQIKFPAAIVSAEEVNGVEEKIADASFSGNALNVSATAFAPKTYRVRLAAAPVTVASPEVTKIELPYNELAITSDAFSAFGHMGQVSEAFHSYAAEVMPSEIVFNNVPFTMGRADFHNAVRCKGQSVALPQGTCKVAMLVAASECDKPATFDAGIVTEVNIPYYTGTFGQYGWEGYYDSFLRTGDIAYVGTHRHHSRNRNEIMAYTYMFYVEVPVDADAASLVLPDDENVVVFAATAIQR